MEHLFAVVAIAIATVAAIATLIVIVIVVAIDADVCHAMLMGFGRSTGQPNTWTKYRPELSSDVLATGRLFNLFCFCRQRAQRICLPSTCKERNAFTGRGSQDD